MLHNKLVNIPTNLIMGFLGVGKTTAIINLIKQKPDHENWAVLVNEFGKVGIDGAIYKAAGVTVRELAGGCLCCAMGAPFQVSLNRLIKEVGPDRLLIEPSGLGHPQKVLDRLINEPNKGVLDVRASLCLVDPEKLKDNRYTQHEAFVDQMALADVLVANKIDLADQVAVDHYHQWVAGFQSRKSVVAQTTQGQLDISWLDLPRHLNRQAVFPNAHEINVSVNESSGYQSAGYIFSAATCFEYIKLSDLINQLKVDRIKGIFNTNKGWFMINGSGSQIKFIAIPPSTNSKIEIITQQKLLLDISTRLNQCMIEKMKGKFTSKN